MTRISAGSQTRVFRLVAPGRFHDVSMVKTKVRAGGPSMVSRSRRLLWEFVSIVVSDVIADEASRRSELDHLIPCLANHHDEPRRLMVRLIGTRARRDRSGRHGQSSAYSGVPLDRRDITSADLAKQRRRGDRRATVEQKTHEQTLAHQPRHVRLQVDAIDRAHPKRDRHGRAVGCEWWPRQASSDGLTTPAEATWPPNPLQKALRPERGSDPTRDTITPHRSAV
jgi:hypothetical protein